MQNKPEDGRFNGTQARVVAFCGGEPLETLSARHLKECAARIDAARTSLEDCRRRQGSYAEYKGLLAAAVRYEDRISHVQVEYSSPDGHVSSCNLPRASMEAHLSGEVIGTRLQFPIALAYGLTVHRAQSITLPHVAVHLWNYWLAGQVYVAASRGSTREGTAFYFKCPWRVDAPTVPNSALNNVQKECLDWVAEQQREANSEAPAHVSRVGARDFLHAMMLLLSRGQLAIGGVKAAGGGADGTAPGAQRGRGKRKMETDNDSDEE